MRPVPVLTFTGPTPRMPGFPYLWLKYVRGFDSTQHCARCLIGPYSEAFKIAKGANKNRVWGGDIRTGLPIELGEAPDHPFLYLCGVSTGYRWANNLHCAFRPAEGSVITGTTWNGYAYRIENAEQLEIPALPAGFRGLTLPFTTCRNFQFGWAQWGVPVEGQPIVPQPVEPKKRQRVLPGLL